jgi:hypothetical protein
MIDKLLASTIILAFAGYIVMTIWTFGSYGASHKCKQDADYADCQADNVLGALLVAPAWPFYWSWRLQE